MNMGVPGTAVNTKLALLEKKALSVVLLRALHTPHRTQPYLFELLITNGNRLFSLFLKK